MRPTVRPKATVGIWVDLLLNMVQKNVLQLQKVLQLTLNSK